jgi:hypothetical protein
MEVIIEHWKLTEFSVEIEKEEGGFIGRRTRF